MKNKFLQYTFLGCSLVVLFSACRKDPFSGTETKQSGKDFVYFTESNPNNQFFDVFTDVKPVTVFTVRKDAASNAVNAKASTVTLTALPSYIDAYNTANGTSYTLLPTDIYTIATSTDNASSGGITATGTGLTLNFAGGEFVKNVIFKVDGSKVDLSKQYAVAYAITNTDGLTKKKGQDTILATIAIKNRWDGTYAFTGTMTDIANASLTHINDYLSSLPAGTSTPAPMQYELRTISATQNVVYDNYLGAGIAVDITNAGSASRYGSVGIIVTFDPATNKVVSMVNYYGQPAGNTRSLELNPDGVNAYDPGTKSISIKYRMTQPSVIADPPHIRTNWDETWTYIGPR